MLVKKNVFHLFRQLSKSITTESASLRTGTASESVSQASVSEMQNQIISLAEKLGKIEGSKTSYTSVWGIGLGFTGIIGAGLGYVDRHNERRIAEVKSQIDKVDTRINGLDSHLRDDFNKLNDRLDQYNQNVLASFRPQNK